jgi:hypothetical protein
LKMWTICSKTWSRPSACCRSGMLDLRVNL